MKKMKAAILGTGNIGTDILLKLQHSKIVECTLFAGRNPDSATLKIAKMLGVPISSDSINAIICSPSCCDIVFDATSAKAHKYHAPILKKMGKFAIDLTPSNIGKKCVPVLNIDECISEDNVNLITCGGQVAIPIAHAIAKCCNAQYIEIVASIASKSAGSGTRNNIDEFTQTTKDALSVFTKVTNTKAIIILNPAEPPVTMHNTIYVQVDDPCMDKIVEEVRNVEKMVQKYVPGYEVTLGPIYDNKKITTIVKVQGRGDYIPSYAGNLDIITCAAIELAERFALKQMEENNG